MRGLAESDLDDYSRIAVPLILSRFPSWERFATIVPRTDGAGIAVDFNVPCPSLSVHNGLWVSTRNEEISVGFHTHHSHFTNYEVRLNRSEIEAGIQQAVDVVAERMGVASWFRGAAFSGSLWVELPHEGPLPKLLEGLGLGSEFEDMFASCDRATLRSWRGSSDRDEFRVT